MRLIVGLGNPGPEYTQTRHNIGFRVADELARRHNLEFRRGRGRAPSLMARGLIAGQEVVVMKSLTMMNNSGIAARAAADFFKLGPADLLIVHDEMDLPLGHVRLIPGGPDNGHNGVRSVSAHLGTDAVPRLRVGIGRPADGGTIADVSSALAPDEELLPQHALGMLADAVELALRIS